MLFVVLVVAIPMIAIDATAQEVPELQITSSRYIVVDAATGNIFAQRNANEQVAIASLTKVFTAVQAMEMAPLDTIITTSDFDLRAPDGDYFGSRGTLMGFGEGESYTLEDMLYGMLLPSGNDAALAIARSLGAQPGDSEEQAVQHFMDLLNQRIDDMGLENTHLMNPHGWGVDGHFSSAADIASFNRFVTHYPTLIEIMGTSGYTTENGAISVSNTNRSLNQYPSVEAGKTGYDDDAGYCLINIARRDETEMIAVTLDGVAPGDWYDDNATLLDYGFERQAELLSSGEQFDGEVASFIDPSMASIARFAVPQGAFVAAPNPTAAATPATQEPVVAQGESPPDDDSSASNRVAETGLWVAGLSAVALLGVRGLITFRKAKAKSRLATPGATSPRSRD
jgi:D-alanyl-D-alanine carboxypeptidase (penicillin-binding protein 5/6)